jgi:hypothetical protein
VLRDPLDQIREDEQIGTVGANGADDTCRCQKAMIERDAVPITPIRTNARTDARVKSTSLRHAPGTKPACTARCRAGTLEAMD